MKIQDALARLDDVVNPLLVREVHRTLRGRIFLAGYVGALMTFLLVVVFAVEPHDVARFAKGEDVFLTLLLIYTAFAWLAVPFYGARWIWEERRDDTFPILSITTLGPWRMVMGRLAAGVVQLLLVLAVLAPFATFAYLLRGLDLRLVAESLVSVVAVGVLFLLAGIFVSTLPGGRHSYSFLAAFFLVGLFVAFVFGIATFVELTRAGRGHFVEGGLLGVLGAVAPLCLVLLCASRASLAPPTTNYSAAVRASVVGTIVLWFLAWIGLDTVTTSMFHKEAILLWSLPSLGLVTFLAIGVVGEPETLSPRVRRQAARLGRGRIKFQRFVSVFFTGRGTGYALIVVLTVMISGLHYVFSMNAGNPDLAYPIPILGCYQILFFGLGLIVCRHVLPEVHRTPIVHRTAPFLVAAVLGLLSFVAYLVVDYDRHLIPTDFLNPVVVLTKLDARSRDLALLVAMVAAGVAVLANADLLSRSYRQISRAKHEVEA